MYKSVFLLTAIVLCMATGLFSMKHDDQIVSMGNLKGTMEVKKPSLANRVQVLEDQIKTNLVESQNPLFGYINFEFLYWRANPTLWHYATEAVGQGLIGGIINILGKPEWKPGYRIELGFSTSLNWNISAMWTHHDSKSHSHYNSEDILVGENLFAATEARTLFRTKYNIGDLQLSNFFSVLKNLYIKPYVSARGAWIKCHEINQYLATHPTKSSQTVGKYRDADNWYGFGPSLGTTGYFNIGKSGFSFFGGVSTALLYGNEKQKINYNILSIHDGTTRQYEIRQSNHQLKAHLQLLVGADFKWKFDQETKAFSLHAAWESNYWWRLGEQPPLLMIANSGIQSLAQDLTFYGVDVGIGFDY